MVNIPSPYKEELHTALCAVKAGHRRPSCGICSAVMSELCKVFSYEGDLESAEMYLSDAMLSWHKSSEDINYPVGGFHEYLTEVDAGTIWQNPRRLELLDYLIKQTA